MKNYALTLCIVMFPLIAFAQTSSLENKSLHELEFIRDSVNRMLSEEISLRRDSVNQKLYKVAYVAPTDSLKIAEWPYNRTAGTKISLHSIEIRENDTKVTFLQHIYWDWQWLNYGKGYTIVDRVTGDQYKVRGYDGGGKLDRLMIIQNCNGKAIYVSLLFPKLKKDVKRIDIISYPHKDNVRPSNPASGDGTAYLNINIEDYLVKPSREPQIYE
ncbi:hypothetical protein [Bacteroides sp. UBA939]|uniref:hypothetical protein n=1 Tax=Bacteroides sp. UBA939 TaxID=1946092 RepID=UPI0025B97ED2|nr:hypothetical protein [Bacteroides sp. UBA939]